MTASLPRQTVCLGLCSPDLLTASIAAPKYPRNFHGLGEKIGHPNLPDLVLKHPLQQAPIDFNRDADQPPSTDETWSPHERPPSRACSPLLFI